MHTSLSDERSSISPTPRRQNTVLSSQTEQKVTTLLSTSLARRATRQVRHIRIIRQTLRELSLRLNPSDHNKTITTLSNRLTDLLGGLSFTLSTNDASLPLLLRLLDDEARALGLLLRDLLVLDRLCEFLAERQVRDRHVFERDVKLGRAPQKVRPYPVRDGFALCDELCGVELRYDRFQDFVSDRWQNALVVILAEVLQEASVGVLVLVLSTLSVALPGRSLAAPSLLVGAALAASS